MAKIRIFKDLVKQEVNIDLNELMDLNREDELTNFVAPWFDHNLGFNYDQYTVGEFDDTIPENFTKFAVKENNNMMIDEAIEELSKADADNIAIKVAQQKNLGKPSYLSHGKHGYAYNIGSNKILKITTDISEAVESKKIQGKKNTYLSDIYGVYQIKYDVNDHIYYAVLEEKLKTDLRYFKLLTDNLNKFFGHLFDLDYADIIYDYYIKNRQEYDGYFKPEIDEKLIKFQSTYDYFYNLLAIADELKTDNVDSSDFLTLANLGYKPSGVIGFFDIGYGEGYNGSSDNQFADRKPEEIEIGEDLEYYHVTDATKDKYELTEEDLNKFVDNIQERIKYYMPGSVEVSVKEKCRIGGNGDGTSTACNQGDIDNLILKPIPTENKEVKNIPNQLHEDKDNVNYQEKLINLQKKFPDYNLRYEKSKKFKNAYTGSLYKNNKYLYGLKGPVSIEQLFDFYDNILNNGDQIHEDNHNFKFKKKDDPEYGCLMLALDIPNWDEIISFVDKDDIYDEEDFGLQEEFPHCTILYGFHEDVTSDDVFELYKSITSLQPVDINLTGISYFETDDFDVVKFDVEPTKTLKRLNRYMKELPYTNDFPDFIPHVTVSYLKKGTGKKYNEKFKSIKHLVSNELVFSDKDSKKTTLNLNNKKVLNNITEDPDSFNIDGIRTTFRQLDAIPFAMVKGQGDKVFVGLRGQTHGSIIELYSAYKLDRISDFIYDGRIWVDKKIISFWKYPPKEMLKQYMINLSAELKKMQDINTDIWNDPEYKIEVRDTDEEGFDVDSKSNVLIPLKQYAGSDDWSEEQKQQHIQSPMNKTKQNVPQGVGSKRYGEKKPLEYRQALQKSEAIINIKNIIKETISNLTEDPDVINVYGISADYRDMDAIPFTMAKGQDDKVFVGTNGGMHGSIQRMYPEYKIDRLDNFIYDGRIWIDQKIISFWTYPPKNIFKQYMINLQAELKKVLDIDVNIWNDPNFKIEVRNVDDEGNDINGTSNVLIPLNQYNGSEDWSEEQKQQHLLSPMQKKKTEVPQGLGSKKYGEKKPLEYRQALQKSESLNIDIRNLIKETIINENPDHININGKRLADYGDLDARPFAMIEDYGNDVFVGDPQAMHDEIYQAYDIPVDIPMKYEGRIWTNRKIISFWNYPPRNIIKTYVKNLGDALNINIWDDPDYRIEVKDIDTDDDSILIPLQQYDGSINPSDAEKQQHLLSPIQKKKTEVPQGVGSKRYLEKKPLAYQQALHGEGVIKGIINDTLNENFNRITEKTVKSIINDLLYEDVDGEPEKQLMTDVKYVDQTPMENEKCGNCGWFNKFNNQCGIVKGQINPLGWCKLWGTKAFCNEQKVRNLIKEELNSLNETFDMPVSTEFERKEESKNIVGYHIFV